MRLNTTLSGREIHVVGKKSRLSFRRWDRVLSSIGVLQFLVCLMLAITWYAGGHSTNFTAPGYSFSKNFLSDLGMTRGWSHRSNIVACRVFNTSIVVLSISVIPFLWRLPHHAPDRSGTLRWASFFGITSTFGLAWLGLTPYNLKFDAHNRALYLWGIGLLLMAGLHAWAIWKSEYERRLFAMVSASLFLAICLYVCCGMEMTVTRFLRGRSPIDRSVVMQKVVVAAAVLWFIVFSIRGSRRSLPTTGRRLHLARLDELADRYLDSLPTTTRVRWSSEQSRQAG